MLKSDISYSYWILRSFKDIAKSRKMEVEEIESAIEKSKTLISKKIYEIFDNITVYPSFCKKEEIIDKILERLNKGFERNKEAIQERIKGMLCMDDPIRALFRYLTLLLKDSEKDANEELKNFLNYIINSNVPVDFLDDMVMAYHYIARYFYICQKIVNSSMRTRAYQQYKSRGTSGFKNILNETFYKTAALLDNLKDLYDSLLTIEIFISLWSAEDCNSLFKKRTKWEFNKILKNQEAYNEFERLKWELKNAMERVRNTDILMRYGHLYREKREAKRSTETLWDDLLYTLT